MSIWIFFFSFHFILSLLRIVKPAVRVLSADMYKTAFRCFYELLQNADDCDYEDGVVPTFDVTIDDACVAVRNNERHGFDENDVLALCSIGQSTKSGSNQTGRKGIGFKSVFALST